MIGVEDRKKSERPAYGDGGNDADGKSLSGSPHTYIPHPTYLSLGPWVVTEIVETQGGAGGGGLGVKGGAAGTSRYPCS